MIGQKEGAYCVSFESFAYINLGYTDCRELGPGEIAYITPEGVETVLPPGDKMKICSFLWVYYGYPTSSYEGVQCGGYEIQMRKHAGKAGQRLCPAGYCGRRARLRRAHAIGYSNESGIPTPVLLSSTRPHGPGPLCLRTRAREISSHG